MPFSVVPSSSSSATAAVTAAVPSAPGKVRTTGLRGAGSSSIVQFRSAVPLLAMVSVWLVVVLLAWVLASNAGLTSMFGAGGGAPQARAEYVPLALCGALP